MTHATVTHRRDGGYCTRAQGRTHTHAGEPQRGIGIVATVVTVRDGGEPSHV